MEVMKRRMNSMKARLAILTTTLGLLALNTADMITGNATNAGWIVTALLGVLGIAAFCDVLRPLHRKNVGMLPA
ncbi:MAG: hypothetical protein K6A68_03245 [Clostridiales bacterium]|nr:hypothetical protein [Clostridiales bacterium]